MEKRTKGSESLYLPSGTEKRTKGSESFCLPSGTTPSQEPRNKKDMNKKDMNKKDMKRLATRKKIVDAATHLFARLGYHKTTIQDIAQRIGMTTGAVFHHFGSKNDILDTVVEELSSNLERYIEFLDGPHQDFRAMVAGLTEIFVHRYRHDPDSIIGLTSLSAEFSGIRDPIIVNIQSAYDRFVDAFERAMNRFSKNPAHRGAGICFIAALQGVAIQALLRGDEISIEELVNGFTALANGDL
ncbi:MAG: TetR/AcrR family transcriptional regulator [Desulfamplus sp.]|nr:TetR/AcrR family transcriptional regulator [Desulfamplus sp.]